MSELKDTFGQDFAIKSFQTIDGEQRIVGKYGQISKIGKLWDVWFVQPDLSPLTMHRINRIERELSIGSAFVKLNGEAFVQTRDLELVRRMVDYCGIRKRRKVSDEFRAKAAERFEKMRADK